MHHVESPMTFRKNLRTISLFEVNHTNRGDRRDTEGTIDFASKKVFERPPSNP